MKRKKCIVLSGAVLITLLLVSIATAKPIIKPLPINETDTEPDTRQNPPEMQLEDWNLVGQWRFALISGVITSYDDLEYSGGIYYLKDIEIIGKLIHVDFLGRRLIIRGLGNSPYISFENKKVMLTIGQLARIGVRDTYNWNDEWYIGFRYARAIDVKLYEFNN